MYSEKVRKALKSRGIKTGDRVCVKKLGKETEGLLMPQTGAGDPETLIIKLDNGYNVGIRFKDAGISKSMSREPASIRKESDYEKGSGKIPRLRFKPSKPSVSMISVGGTITSKLDYRTGGVTALSKPSEILHNVP
ncbi:MAG: hypothetical protein DRO99_04960, partial [Candidatus Aenigmatarchaeota archaeon]